MHKMPQKQAELAAQSAVGANMRREIHESRDRLWISWEAARRGDAGMWSQERHARMLELLAEEERLSTARIADALGVSRETARRDLIEMEAQGLLRRVHGGAVRNAASPAPEASYQDRKAIARAQKHAIGRAAAAMLPEGATCFVDAGTTTAALAAALVERPDVQVITNSMDVARILSARPDNRLLLLGGRPHPRVPATFGEMTLGGIERFLVDFALIGPVAVDPDRGVMDYDLNEAEIARSMMLRARRRVVLADGRKIGAESRVAICRLDEIDHLVTDATADPAVLARIAAPQTVAAVGAGDAVVQQGAAQGTRGRS
jgi:DeoR/GlpR family transcriptional regulator of sugar metabolism